MTGPAPLRHRVFFTTGAVLLAAGLLVVGWPQVSNQSDFDLQIHAAQALLAGENPYLTVGPGSDRFFPFGYYYPLPAAFFALPFVWLPVEVVRVIFVLVTTGLLGWFASRDGWLRAPMFALSGPFLSAVFIGQWSMLLTAALLTPALAWAAAVKPNFAAAFQVARWDRAYLWGLLPAVILAVLAFAFVPTWPLDWLRAVRSAPDHLHTPLVFYPGGFAIVLLAVLLARRTFEGRLLAGLACIPQTGLMYDPLPLFLVAKTQAQGWFLWACSLAAMYAQAAATEANYQAVPVPVEQYVERFAVLRGDVSASLVWLMYLPALAVVLWNGNRNQEGERCSDLQT